MIKNRIFVFAIVMISILFNFNCPAPDPRAASWQFFSPDQNLKVNVNNTQNRLTYEVLLKSGQDYKTVIKPSVLGIERKDQSFLNNLQFKGFQKQTIRDEYQLIAGKRKNNSYSANEIVLDFVNMNGKKMQVIFRIYNDGVAFKYHFPGNSESIYIIIKELSEFALPADGIAWMLPYDSVGVWSPAYEAVFEKEIPVGTPAPSSTGWGFPALFSLDGSWVLLTESGLNESYGGSHLAAKSEDGRYRIKFPMETESYGLGSSYPQFTLPWSTPWRVIITGTNLGTIVESNLVTHLAEQCRLDDKSWIKPGKCSWSWWSDHSSARNYNTLKSYIDLSAEMGWDYSLVDAEWDYMDGGNLEQLAKYAASKNVGLFVWYNSGGPHNKAKAMYRITEDIMQDFASENVFSSDELKKLSPVVNQYYFDDVPYHRDIEQALEQKLSAAMKSKILRMTFNPNATPRDRMHERDVRRREFQKLRDIGVKGVKIDFFNSDKQDIIKLYLDIVRDAEDFHLLVNTHGCTIPRGWQRTYPNFISMEAVRGAELYSIASYPPRAVWLNALYPFTRNVIGPMDYTPVTFSDYSPETAHITTNAHELALSVIFECGIQHFADRRESYEAQPDYVRRFLSEVPVTWDKTIFIDGYPGKHIILARQEGATWYIAGINGEMQERTFSFKMPFLVDGKHQIRVITDNGQPRKCKIEDAEVTNSRIFEINVLPAGGFVGFIEAR